MAKGKRLRPDRMRPLGAHRAPDQFTFAPFGSLLQAETSWSRPVDPVAWHVLTYGQHGILVYNYFVLPIWQVPGAVNCSCMAPVRLFVPFFTAAFRSLPARVATDALRSVIMKDAGFAFVNCVPDLGRGVLKG